MKKIFSNKYHSSYKNILLQDTLSIDSLLYELPERALEKSISS